jgi:hypothetical protein
MGYTTDFNGELNIVPPLNKEQVEYINRLCTTRRMKRDVNKLMELYKGEHGNPFAKEKTPEAIYGRDGEFFARPDGQSGQTHDESIINYNCPPGQVNFEGENKNGQPGLWCQWEVSEDGEVLVWDGGEKFYNYVEWLKYLIKTFFKPWGVVLNGEIYWEGEDSSDMGCIVVKDNKVKTKVAEISYRESDDDDDEE